MRVPSRSFEFKPAKKIAGELVSKVMNHGRRFFLSPVHSK